MHDRRCAEWSSLFRLLSLARRPGFENRKHCNLSMALSIPLWGDEERRLLSSIRDCEVAVCREQLRSVGVERGAVIFVESRSRSFMSDMQACSTIPEESIRLHALNNLLRLRLIRVIDDYQLIFPTHIYPLSSFVTHVVRSYSEQVAILADACTTGTQLRNIHDSVAIVDRRLAKHFSLLAYTEAVFQEKAKELCSEPISLATEHYATCLGDYFEAGICGTRQQLVLDTTEAPDWLPDGIPVELSRFPCLLRIAAAGVEVAKNRAALGELFQMQDVHFDLPAISSDDPTAAELTAISRSLLIPFIETLGLCQ